MKILSKTMKLFIFDIFSSHGPLSAAAHSGYGVSSVHVVLDRVDHGVFNLHSAHLCGALRPMLCFLALCLGRTPSGGWFACRLLF